MSQNKSTENILQILKATYPIFAIGKPLAVGVLDELERKHPELDRRLLARALLKHCRRPGYLARLLTEEHRYHLDGQSATDVKREHQIFARRNLDVMENSRAKKLKEQRTHRKLLRQMERETRKNRIVLKNKSGREVQVFVKKKSGNNDQPKKLVLKKRTN